MTEGSQKFIARNRAPRVQIEYDVELYGSEKKVQLPFVMGVMSDLSGKSRVAQPSVADRSFLEIDVDNFDSRMKAMQPRAAFTVPNTLTGEGNLSVDLTFEKLDDFSPAAVASKMDALRPLLEARRQLSDLVAYMDGKAGAEALIEKILSDTGLMSAISATSDGGIDSAEALESLRALTPTDGVEDDGAAGVLDGLRQAAADEAPETDDHGAVLAGLAAVAVVDVAQVRADDVLAGLADAAPKDLAETDAVGDGLGRLASVEITEAEVENTDELLATLAQAAGEQSGEQDVTDDVLDSLAAVEIEDVGQDTTDEFLATLAADLPHAAETPDDTAAALDSLADIEVTEAKGDNTDALLAELAADLPDQEGPADVPSDEILADLTEAETGAETGAETASDLDDLLADLTDVDAGESDLDELLGALEDDTEVAAPDEETNDLDDLLAGLADDSEVADEDTSNDLDDLLNDDDLETGADAGSDDLDDLLAGLGDGTDSNLDDLLAEDQTPEGVEDDLDDLLAGLGDGDELDGLLDGLDDAEPQTTDDGAQLEDPEFAYGQLRVDRPAPERLNRKRFRLAILGDFSGRAARGLLEAGDDLAARAPILLDPDTVEDVIEAFATDLVLPIGKDGAGVAVKLGGLDDLHPDELYENVELFAELVGLRGQLASGATADHAMRRLRAWGEKHGKVVAPARTTSSGNAVPADLKLSDFQKLIGDTAATLTQPSPIEDLLARIVGPHIRAVPDADAVAMQGAVDEALSAAMRLVLHHPEFQSLEAQWRSIDLIARSVETDDTLDVILYDISAEEIAADLATADDLATSGFVRLLTEGPLDPENGRGGYSALIGLYTFEETPPHAELLGRIARVAAHVDAPFFAAISPTFLDTEKQDRHPLVATAWDTLRAMPEAKHLGIVSPRFLLRRPYGAKSEPIYEFTFEEFTMAKGLGGMLWANPVVLVAILLAKSYRENGASMGLGSIMSLGGMPYHFVTDSYGDQVALPCTERNLTLDKVEKAVVRGYMSVVSIKGRDDVRLASFQSLGGGEILGPWSDIALPDPSPPNLVPVDEDTDASEDEADTGADIEDLDNGEVDIEVDDTDLDDLLANFADDTDTDDEDDLDAELAALLGDL